MLHPPLHSWPTHHAALHSRIPPVCHGNHQRCSPQSPTDPHVGVVNTLCVIICGIILWSVCFFHRLCFRGLKPFWGWGGRPDVVLVVSAASPSGWRWVEDSGVMGGTVGWRGQWGEGWWRGTVGLRGAVEGDGGAVGWREEGGQGLGVF